jgi:predicted transcriptional regulator
MQLEFFEVNVTDSIGHKDILLVTVDDLIEHIYTIDVTSDRLCEKRPVHYHEDIQRVLYRISARGDTEIFKISLKDALMKAYQANRTSVAVSILKKLRAYRRREEDLKNVKESTSARN